VIKTILNSICLLLVALGLAAGQTRDTSMSSTENWQQVITELRETRQAVEQLGRELKELQVTAIRIRVQQDVVARKEGQLDSVRSEAQITEDALGQIRQRLKLLESNNATVADDDAEQQRVLREKEEAKSERDREQQRLDLLRSRESQLMSELQLERANLEDRVGELEMAGTRRIDTRSGNQLKPSDPKGPRKQ
jgi:chromosome segregation ATPase